MNRLHPILKNAYDIVTQFSTSSSEVTRGLNIGVVADETEKEDQNIEEEDEGEVEARSFRGDFKVSERNELQVAQFPNERAPSQKSGNGRSTRRVQRLVHGCDRVGTCPE